MDNTLLTRLSASQIRAFYSSGHWASETIYSSVQVHAEASPDKIAVREGSRTITYRALTQAADRLAASLLGRGLRSGQRVAVWLPSRIETAVATVACSRSGLVMCPSLHRTLTVLEVIDLAKRMRAAALIAEAGYGADGGTNDVFAAAVGLDSMLAVVKLDPRTDDGDGSPIFGDIPAPSEVEAPRVDPDTIVYLAFTSGTTGQPKGVMHSDNTLLANAREFSSDWSLDQGAVVYSLSPVSHNLGFGAMLMSLTVGCEFVIHDLPRGESLVERLRQTEATFVVGVPTHAVDLLSELRAGSQTLPRIRGFRISGAPSSSAVVEGLLEHGIVPQSGYGMTEAGSHHYTLPDDDPELIVETSGRACAGYEVAIFDRQDPDRQLLAGEPGQIGGRGASLMLGYFDDQAATEDAFNADGWFMTGDLGWMDEAGYLRVTGRTKDLIIRGGHNVYPARVEDLAMRHETVARAAAVPVADERLGERVCLVVTATPGHDVDADDLLAHLDDAGLSKYDMPEYLIQVDEIPVTPSGKILKRSLIADIEHGRLQPEPVRFVARK